MPPHPIVRPSAKKQKRKSSIDYVAGEPEIVALTNILVRNIRDRGEPNGRGLFAFDRVTIQQKGSPGRIRVPEKLDIALNMLIRLGHLEYNHGHQTHKYRFKETVIGMKEPELKNGEQYYIKELPRFANQYYKRHRSNAYLDPGYEIKLPK